MDSTVHGGGVVPAITERVYYTGSDTLLEGYALCYNFNASDVSAENLVLSAGADEECAARRLQVAKPSYLNSLHFAGVVSGKCTGFVGPGWVEINKPGSVCNIFCNADADQAGTNSVNTGQVLTFSTGQYYFKYAGLPGAGAALVLQDVDRSTTAGLVMAELLVGYPSGGYNIVISSQMFAGATVSTGGSVTKFPPAGITALHVTALTADVTLLLKGAMGKWVGQTKIFRVLGTLDGGDDFLVSVSLGHRAIASTLLAMGDAAIVASLDAAGEQIMCVWTGNRWEVYPNAVGV